VANPTQHADQELPAGDAWTIAGTLLDTNGAALDLTSATLEWTLIDMNGNLAIPDDSATITIQTPPTAGLISITVPSAITEGLLPGRYTDALRVTISGNPDTIWTGSILVDADLFSIQGT